jgi:RNA polymerase sigma factor (sigma-70 family)
MTDAPDDRLLEQFARNGSEEAFAALVQRHIALVHSVALRHTANAQHAEDITQAVFIILARKAGALGRKTVLPGWLYHTARLTAANLQRAEARRIRREQEAFMQSKLEESTIDTLWPELRPQLFQRAAHPFLGRVFACAQDRADFAQIPPFIKSQQDDLAVFFAQAGDGIVQQRRDPRPDVMCGFIQISLHIRLLFAAMAAHFASHKIAGRQACGLKQPTGKSLVMTQLHRLFCQNDKDCLRNFLGILGMANLPQSDRIDQIDMPRYQRAKSLVGIVFRVLSQQRAVIGWLHLRISVRRPTKPDNLFANFNGLKFLRSCRRPRAGAFANPQWDIIQCAGGV